MQSLFQRSWKNPRLWQLALACYWLALFLGTHMPIERLALSRGSTDKFAHVAAFAVLALLLAITWRLSAGQFHVRELLSVWVIVMLYGAIEESSQPLVGRTASLVDWLADAIGATLGLAVYWWWPGRWLNRLVPATEEAEGEARPHTWRRYSLRTLFFAMTVVAVACYWIVLPTMNAQRFVRAMHEHEYTTAESLFVSDSDKFPGAFKTSDDFEADPRIGSLTWGELWKGERRILVRLSYGDENGKSFHRGATIFAYRRGLALHPLIFSLPSRPNKA